MPFSDLMMISIALGSDAFGVALSLGFNKKINRYNALAFVISFSFFQFLFAYIGGLLGNAFNKHIFAIPSIGGGLIILTLGIIMINEGIKRNENIIKINLSAIIILGICVSIDALLAGFSTLNIIKFNLILLYSSLIIGITTFSMCIIAFTISKYSKKIYFINNYSSIIGGIILIILGIKMIL